MGRRTEFAWEKAVRRGTAKHGTEGAEALMILTNTKQYVIFRQHVGALNAFDDLLD